MKCPCCGSDIASPPDMTALVEIDARPQVLAVAELLLGNYPRTASVELMSDHLYGALPGGGPDDARGVVLVNVSRLKKAIEPLGWGVRRIGGAGYRLEKVV